MKTQNEKNIAFITHLSGFGNCLIPFGSFLIPLIIFETKKNKSAFISENAKNAVNFNISYLLYSIVAAIIFIPLTIFNSNIIDFDFNHFELNVNDFPFIGSIGILSVFFLVKIILVLYAAIQSHKGFKFEYPFTIKFLK